MYESTSAERDETIPDWAFLMVLGWLVGFIPLPWVLFLTGPVGKRNWLYPGGHPGFLRSLLPDMATPTGAAITWLLWIAGLVLMLVFLIHRSELASEILVGAALLVIFELIGLFSAMYSQAAHDHPTGVNACFAYVPGPTGRLHPAVVGHWDALYFTIGLLTTAGTGSLQPSSAFCHRIATGQMLIDFVTLGVAVTLLITRLSKIASKPKGDATAADSTSQTPPRVE